MVKTELLQEKDSTGHGPVRSSVYESSEMGILVNGVSRATREGGLGLFMDVVGRKGEAGIRLRRTNSKACGLGTGLAGALLEVKPSFKITC